MDLRESRLNNFNNLEMYNKLFSSSVIICYLKGIQLVFADLNKLVSRSHMCVCVCVCVCVCIKTTSLIS